MEGFDVWGPLSGNLKDERVNHAKKEASTFQAKDLGSALMLECARCVQGAEEMKGRSKLCST